MNVDELINRAKEHLKAKAELENQVKQQKQKLNEEVEKLMVEEIKNKIDLYKF